MRTLIVTALYPSEESRRATGDTFAVRNLVETANTYGLNATTILRLKPILSRRGFWWPRKHEINGIELYDIPVVGLRLWYSVSLTQLFLPDLRLNERFDIAICHKVRNVNYARFLLHRYYRKLVYVVHHSDLGHPFLPRELSYVDSIFARSVGVAKEFEKSYSRSVDGIVTSGITKTDLCDMSLKNLGRSEVNVVIACSLIELKNVPACLKAIAALRKDINVNVDIYGSGPMQRQVEKTIRQFGLCDIVHIHGFRPRREVLQAMFNADLFLMPSVQETFGLAFLEAMSQGCVVIGHEGCGIDGIVKDGVNGFLVDSATPAAIERKIHQYLESDRWSLHRDSFKTAQRNTAELAGRNYYQHMARAARGSHLTDSQ